MKNFAVILILVSLFVTQSLEAQTVDVTAKVKASVSGGLLTISADNDTMGGDPAVNVPKKLKVEYTLGDVAASKVVMENGILTIKIPADKKLVITKATFGDLPDKIVDVTDNLTVTISNNALSINVDNDTLGGDPAPTLGKDVHVSYTVNGTPHTATAHEGDILTLPLSSDGKGTLVILDAKYGVFQ